MVVFRNNGVMRADGEGRAAARTEVKGGVTAFASHTIHRCRHADGQDLFFCAVLVCVCVSLLNGESEIREEADSHRVESRFS